MGDGEYAHTQISYDAEDRERTVVEAVGLEEQRTRQVASRDGMGNPTEVVDYRGNSTHYVYNAVYEPVRETDSLGGVIETSYTATGKVERVVDRRVAGQQRVTRHAYDLLDRRVLTEDPLGNEVERGYDDVGNLEWEVDARGIATLHEYDSLYRRVRTERADQQVERWEYNDVGKVVRLYDAYDRLVESYEYDDRHLLSRTVFTNDGDVNSDEQRWYDGNGNLVRLVGEAGLETNFTYDAEDRELTRTFVDEQHRQSYDAIGNLVAQYQPEAAEGGKFEGRGRHFAYDGLRRLVRVDEPALDAYGTTLSTSYGYDAGDNLRHIHDPLGHHVEYAYDALGRRIRHIQHKGSGDLVTRFGYDGAGNLTSVVDARGNSFSYRYDKLDRRIRGDYPNVPSPLLTLATIDYSYDPNSNLTRVEQTKRATDASTVVDVVVNGYDDFDRLATSTRRGLAIDYSYDANGNRLRLFEVSGHGAPQRTEYDYAGYNRAAERRYEDGALVAAKTYVYDETNWLLEVLGDGDGGSWSVAYSYDANGNTLSKTDSRAPDEVVEYSYSARDRLVQASRGVAGQRTVLGRYDYDHAGNRIRKRHGDRGDIDTYHDDGAVLAEYELGVSDTGT